MINHMKRSIRSGGCFLLPYPTVANSFRFQKRSALCCSDFPLVAQWPPAAEPEHCILIFSAKVMNLIMNKVSEIMIFFIWGFFLMKN